MQKCTEKCRNALRNALGNTVRNALRNAVRNELRNAVILGLFYFFNIHLTNPNIQNPRHKIYKYVETSEMQCKTHLLVSLSMQVRC